MAAPATTKVEKIRLARRTPTRSMRNTSGQHGHDGGHAVHGVHGADGGAVGVEDLDEGGLDGADAIIGEVTAESHQRGEGQDDEPVRSGGGVQDSCFR